MSDKEKLKDLYTNHIWVKDPYIKWSNYPKEFCALNEERFFLSNFPMGAWGFFTGGLIKRLKDFVINLPKSAIDHILNIEMDVMSLGEKWNILEIMIRRINNTLLSSETIEWLIFAIDHMVRKSEKGKNIFIENKKYFYDFTTAGHSGQAFIKTVQLIQDFWELKKEKAKLEWKLPFKSLKGILEINKTSGKYSHITLGLKTIQLTPAWLDSAKLEYLHFLEEIEKKIKNTSEYTKKFNIWLILWIVLLHPNKLEKNKDRYIGHFNLTDKDLKDSFKRAVKWFKKHIEGFAMKETVNFKDYIPHVRKVLERCWLQEKIKITTRRPSECNISIFLVKKQ